MKNTNSTHRNIPHQTVWPWQRYPTRGTRRDFRVVLARLAHNVAILALEYLDGRPHLVQADGALKVLVEHGQVGAGAAQAAAAAAGAQEGTHTCGGASGRRNAGGCSRGGRQEVACAGVAVKVVQLAFQLADLVFDVFYFSHLPEKKIQDTCVCYYWRFAAKKV